MNETIVIRVLLALLIFAIGFFIAFVLWGTYLNYREEHGRPYGTESEYKQWKKYHKSKEEKRQAKQLRREYKKSAKLIKKYVLGNEEDVEAVKLLPNSEGVVLVSLKSKGVFITVHKEMLRRYGLGHLIPSMRMTKVSATDLLDPNETFAEALEGPWTTLEELHDDLDDLIYTNVSNGTRAYIAFRILDGVLVEYENKKIGDDTRTVHIDISHQLNSLQDKYLSEELAGALSNPSETVYSYYMDHEKLTAHYRALIRPDEVIEETIRLLNLKLVSL